MDVVHAPVALTMRRPSDTRPRVRPAAIALAALLGAAACTPDRPAAAPDDLVLEARIPLGEVKGRIDHLAMDASRGDLFIAELGNDSVAIVDLGKRQVIARLGGLSEPQGLGFVVSTDDLYVANGGDGSVRIFNGANFKSTGRIDLGDDADNVRVDDKAGRVFVGYGGGALAVIDAKTRTSTTRFPLPVHPESFQLDPNRAAIYVNMPGAHRIAVVDRVTGKQTGSLPPGMTFANYPMALDSHGARLAVVFRAPSQLLVFDLADDKAVARLGVCGDADDVFFDESRDRLYVICGQGFVDVVARQNGRYQRVARIPTAPGARTGFWSASLDRLYVAAPTRSEAAAAVLVMRPDAKGRSRTRAN